MFLFPFRPTDVSALSIFRHCAPPADALRNEPVTATAPRGMSLVTTRPLRKTTFDNKPKYATQMVSVIFGRDVRKLNFSVKTFRKEPCPAKRRFAELGDATYADLANSERGRAPATGKDWVDMIQRECQRNEDRRPQSFDWYKLVTQAMWMPLALLQADPPQPCEGTVMLMSKNQVEICRRILKRAEWNRHSIDGNRCYLEDQL